MTEQQYQNEMRKMIKQIELLNIWLFLKQKGKHVKTFFKEHGIQTVAIYGMSLLGERLFDELEESGIEVRYGIDINPSKILSRCKIYVPNEDLPQVDAIIVTPVIYYNEIKRNLETRIDCSIISLEEVLEEI